MMLCAIGTRAGESCNEHPVLLSLPACEPRARQCRTQTTLPTNTPRRPFQSGAHHVRATSRSNKRSCRLRLEICQRDRRSIARGARGNDHDKWFRSWTPPRGSVWKRAPEEWRPPQRGNTVQGAVRGAKGGAAVGGGSGTSDGSCCAPVPVSHHGNSLLTWLIAARRYESDSEVVNQWDIFVSTCL